jgi:hypothetical protein
MPELSDLDSKIARINLLRDLLRKDTESATGPIEREINVQIADFITDLLNQELGKPSKFLKQQEVKFNLTAEKIQALDWLLTKIVGLMSGAPVPAPAPVQALQPLSGQFQPVGEPSVHAPMAQQGTGYSKNAKGSGILEMLKGENPDLITPLDPGFKGLTPAERAIADANFRAAVKDHERKAKELVEKGK